MSSFLVMPWIYLAGLVLLLVILSFATITLLKKLIKRKPYDQEPVYHARLMAAGLAAAVFGNTIFFVFISPFIILINLITAVASYLSHTAVVGTMEKGVPFDVSLIGNSFSRYFETLPLGRLLLAFAVGLLLYRLILTVMQEATKPPPTTGSANSALIYNLMIVGVLTFSMFLVISVFISIPYLNEIKKPSLYTGKGIDSTLTAIRLLDTSRGRPVFAASPFFSSSIKDTLLKSEVARANYQRLSSSAQKEIDDLINSIDNDSRSSETRRKTAIQVISKTIDRFAREKITTQDRLSTHYKGTLTNNAINKDLLYTMSVDAYRDYIAGFNNLLDGVTENVLEADVDNSGELTRLINQLSKYINTEGAVPDSAKAQAYYQRPTLPYIQPQFSPYNADYLSEVNHGNIQPEAVVRDGSEWGFFGFIAKYLIEANSQDLVLLIGMLGFGLLGASATSFAQAEKEGEERAPSGNFLDLFKSRAIIPDFWKVLARGFLAAILIYLATKGGITLLTANVSTDPNGYVLLFLCFIGAVYSKKVWEKVAGKI